MNMEKEERGIMHKFRAGSLMRRVSDDKESINWAVISLFVVTIFAYPVMETYFANVTEFDFSAGQVWYCFLLYIALVYIGTGIICVLLHDWTKNFFLFAIWSFSICCYVQGMFLNQKLFLMEGKDPEWDAGLKISNIIIWCVIFGILSVLYKLLKEKRKAMLTYSSVILCVMQMVGAISLIPGYINQEKSEISESNYFSTKGLYEVAREDNVIIFVLDTYDVDFMNEVLTEKPDFLEPLRGFTYFPDTVSQFSRTFPSIPYMLTEEQYYYEEPKNEYIDRSFENCSFWKQFHDEGYKMYFYEQDEENIGGWVKTTAANYTEEGHVINEKMSFTGCAKAITKINAYRLLPYVLKGHFSYTSEGINDLVIKEQDWDVPVFNADDIEVYEEFRKNGLELADESKALRFIHLNGAHAPYTMTEEGTRARNDNGTALEQYIGSMNLVYDYLSMLQYLGMYEKSTIIITADHGENFVSTQLEQNTNPILFIKPSGVGMDREMQISDVYASQNDILPTISEIYGMKYDKDWGLNLFDTHGEDKNRTRYHYFAVVENTIQTKTRTYEINGNSLDFNNWYATDEYHKFGEYY